MTEELCKAQKASDERFLELEEERMKFEERLLEYEEKQKKEKREFQMKLWTMLMGGFGGQQPSGFSTDSLDTVTTLIIITHTSMELIWIVTFNCVKH